MRQVNGLQLSATAQRQALDRFVYRMTQESIVRWPEAARQMKVGGYRMPIRTDAEWLAATLFWVRKDGRLSNRHRYCETTH